MVNLDYESHWVGESGGKVAQRDFVSETNHKAESRNVVRLLLVEDNPDHAWILADQLRNGGFEVHSERVETGEAMREAMKQPWDAVIADNRFPCFSGMEALEIYRESGQDIPFFIVSGTVGEEKAAEFMKAGAHDFILKENTGRLIPALQRELREAHNRRMRREAEAAQRLSQARYQQIVETSSEGIYVVGERSHITFVNTKLAQMLGYPPFSLIGRSIFRFVHPADRRLAAMSWRSPSPTDLRMVRRDGSDLWVMVTATPIRDEVGQRQGILGMITDISERKKLEDQLLLAEVEKKRFCYQLLQTVTKGKFLLVDPDEVPRSGTLLWEVDLKDERAFRELRDFVRRSAMAEGMGAERADDLVVAVGEAAGNAIKHAGSGVAQVRLDGDRIVVQVDDRGPGIRAEDLPASILQQGFSTKISLGMGYSLMLELVDLIWLASRPGGTTLQLAKGIQPPLDPLMALLDRFE